MGRKKTTTPLTVLKKWLPEIFKCWRIIFFLVHPPFLFSWSWSKLHHLLSSWSLWGKAASCALWGQACPSSLGGVGKLAPVARASRVGGAPSASASKAGGAPVAPGPCNKGGRRSSAHASRACSAISACAHQLGVAYVRGFFHASHSSCAFRLDRSRFSRSRLIPLQMESSAVFVSDD
jgi:hypothetical protein